MMIIFRYKIFEAKLKQMGKNGILVLEDVKTMNSLHEFLKRMTDSITPIKA
jgi:transcription-repair coupling factor (superfamily II helicase)